ncbi:MAG: hypothetical protein ACI35V_07475 [Sphingobacterium composti]|uniref:hypothetical protein n=1 Tax=Sphingobacterium composti TaxID=363260 RepID=UPI00135A2532|nr:hypothetical protein [Sphingobacterium composti Ten et al. 2007 non Yoo et al. 2007]
MRNYYIVLLLILSTAVVKAQATFQRIDNFVIKENLTSNGKIAIVAVDSADAALDYINGTFKFTINGFEQSLAFHDGVAVPSHAIESSTFVYFKHKNQEKTTGKLYFLYKKENKITPLKINGLLLLIIPALILLVAYAAKRLLITFIILAIVYGYFSYSKGLSVTQILESAFQVMKNLF